MVELRAGMKISWIMVESSLQVQDWILPEFGDRSLVQINFVKVNLAKKKLRNVTLKKQH
jgi:hypothetical protein